ncbi:MAG: peptidylprolyl isomerase [Fidelibacterota bacterium]
MPVFIFHLFGETRIFKRSFSIILPIVLFVLLPFSCSKGPFSENEKRILRYQNERQLSLLLKEALPLPSPRDRFRLCLAIGNSQDTTLVSALATFLADESAVVRSAATFAAGLLPCRQSQEMLRRQLEQAEDPDIVRQTVLALGRIGNPHHLQAVRKRLHNEADRTTLCTSAVHWFQRGVFDDSLLHICYQTLLSPNQTARQAAAVALQRIRDTDNIKPYVNLLLTAGNSPDTAVRITAARLLKNVQFRGKSEIYRHFLGDTDWRVRYEAVQALPSLENAETLWTALLDDSSAHVVAAAQQNPPPRLILSNRIISKILRNIDSPHRSVRGSAITFIYSREDSPLQKIQDSLAVETAFLPDMIAGFRSRPPSQKIYQTVLPLIDHHQKSVATTAYGFLVGQLDSLLKNQLILNSTGEQLIISGLTSADPVKIFLSAQYISSTSPDSIFLPHLYNCLENRNRYRYTESLVVVIRAIESIHPPDATEILFPLLHCRNRALRQEAGRVLRESYNLIFSSSNIYYDANLYRNLSKLQKYGIDPMVKITTNRGVIVIRCDGFYAPYTVDAFLHRIESGFYDGLLFHRVIPNFVAQSGDPRGDGWGGPAYYLRTERSPLRFEPGTVGMANAGADTEGSQFFITTSAQYHLDANYTLFGTVIQGLSVAERIERGDEIISVTITPASDYFGNDKPDRKAD